MFVVKKNKRNITISTNFREEKNGRERGSEGGREGEGKGDK